MKDYEITFTAHVSAANDRDAGMLGRVIRAGMEQHAGVNYVNIDLIDPMEEGDD